MGNTHLKHNGKYYIFLRKTLQGEIVITGKIQVQETFQEVGTKQLDERMRIPIGLAIKSIFKGVKRYKIFRNSSGDLLLRPVVEIPAREAWLYQNKEALKSIKRGLKQTAKRKVKKLNMSLLAEKE